MCFNENYFTAQDLSQRRRGPGVSPFRHKVDVPYQSWWGFTTNSVCQLEESLTHNAVEYQESLLNPESQTFNTETHNTRPQTQNPTLSCCASYSADRAC